MEREGCDCNVCSKSLLAAIERLEKRDQANTRIQQELLAKVSQLNDLVVRYVFEKKRDLIVFHLRLIVMSQQQKNL